jgi:hypothetical protein
VKQTHARTGMVLPTRLLDRVDARLIAARSAERRRISRTKLTEIALERVLRLPDDEFERALCEPEATPIGAR